MKTETPLKIIGSCMFAAITIIGTASCSTLLDSTFLQKVESIQQQKNDGNASKDGAQINVDKSDIQDFTIING